MPKSHRILVVDDSRLARASILDALTRHGYDNLREAATVAEAFAAGAMDFITKPIREAELLARVRSALMLKRESDRRRRKEGELVKPAHKLAALNKEPRLLSSRDGLTGVANRRFFDESFEREWRRCQRAGHALAVVMMDIDHFKAYNDRYGHQAGDEYLKRVAQAMNRKVAALGLEHLGSPVAGHVTLSLGVAAMAPQPDRERRDLLAAADRALYQAKDRGRNRAVMAGAPGRND